MDQVRRVQVLVGAAVTVLLVVAVAVLVAEGLSPWTMVMLLTIVAIAGMALLLAVRALRDMRSGLPLQDERSRALSARAGNWAFYVSMYLVLFMAAGFAVLEDYGITLSNGELLFIVVALMGSIHIVFSLYYNRKGRGSSG